MTYESICRNSPHKLIESINETNGKIITVFERTTHAKYGGGFTFTFCAILEK